MLEVRLFSIFYYHKHFCNNWLFFVVRKKKEIKLINVEKSTLLEERSGSIERIEILTAEQTHDCKFF